MDIQKLQQKARFKLSKLHPITHINVKQITAVANKEQPLSDDDIEQLTVFVNKTARQMKDVTFYGNSTIDPNTWDKKLYRKTEHKGWIEHYSTKD